MIPCLGFTFASPVPDSTLALIAHKVCLLLLTTRMPSIAERSCKAGSHKSVPPCPPWFGEHLGTSQIARVGHGRGWSRGRNPRALFLFILTPFGTSTQKPTQTSTDPPPPPPHTKKKLRFIFLFIYIYLFSFYYCLWRIISEIGPGCPDHLWDKKSHTNTRRLPLREFWKHCSLLSGLAEWCIVLFWCHTWPQGWGSDIERDSKDKKPKMVGAAEAWTLRPRVGQPRVGLVVGVR